MSLDRFTHDERSECDYARVHRRAGDVYTRDYLGTQREPKLTDEAGAVCVIDSVFGGRVIIFAIPGDSKYRRVERK